MTNETYQPQIKEAMLKLAQVTSVEGYDITKRDIRSHIDSETGRVVVSVFYDRNGDHSTDRHNESSENIIATLGRECGMMILRESGSDRVKLDFYVPDTSASVTSIQQFVTKAVKGKALSMAADFLARYQELADAFLSPNAKVEVRGSVIGFISESLSSGNPLKPKPIEHKGRRHLRDSADFAGLVVR